MRITNVATGVIQGNFPCVPVRVATDADRCDLHYIPVAPHNVASPIGTVAGAHVCAAMNNFLVIGCHAHDVEWWADLVNEGPSIMNGFIALNDRLGHGVTLNEDVARKHLKPGSSFFGENP
jgi:L-alanine-DL-glutamate epimerase-like enolase superfamily enzyme